jgi:hypothetical protein
MKVLIRGSYECSLPVAGPAHFDADSMVAFMHRVVEGTAAEGNCVNVGRGAPYFLRSKEDVFGKSEEAVELVSQSMRNAPPSFKNTSAIAEQAPLLFDDQFQDWRRSCGARDSERRVGSSIAPAASFRLPSAYDEYNATPATTRFATTTGKAWMISP